MKQLNRYPSRPGGMLRSSLPAGTRTDGDLAKIDFLPLIQKLVELRREQVAGVITAFTSVSRGQGVTYVVESLAWQLAHYTGEPILLASGADLAGAAGATFWESQPIQRLNRNTRRASGYSPPSWEDMQILRDTFGFVLLDCPCLRESSEVFALSKMIEGVTLIVAAGEIRREEIEAAQNALEAAEARVLGLILNRQTNPVPRLLSRLL